VLKSVVPGKVTSELVIEKHHTNRLEILHGGTISTMIDLGGYVDSPKVR
jgi:acyl-coenzyme A thioesterase PaaI-like protein